MKSSLAWNAAFWPYFMFIKVRNYLAPNFTTEGFRIQVWVPPANHVYGCHMTPVTRGALDMYLTRKALFKDTLFIGMHQGEPLPCAPRSCFELYFHYMKAPRLFPILHIRTIYFEWLFLMFWCPCYALLVMLNRWNQHNWSILHRLCIWGHRWILILLVIFVDWYNHSNTNIAGSKCILNWFGCIIWRPKAIFDQNVLIT